MTEASTQNRPLIAKRLSWNFDNSVDLLSYKNVHTVCEESRCPNRYECSSLGIATFLIGGRECTRACKFCHIATAKPAPLSAIADKEREDILRSAVDGKYRYLVITSVARDDDEAGLAAHFAAITRDLNARGIAVELLVPDFHSTADHLATIAEAEPAVVAHNMETVERLSPSIRPQAAYHRSLHFFGFFKRNYPHIIRKSAFMVGLGETFEEIEILLADMKSAHIDIVSIGQYLRPSADQAQVLKNYSADEFALLERAAKMHHFLATEIGPFVRSSYMAEETLSRVMAERKQRLYG